MLSLNCACDTVATAHVAGSGIGRGTFVGPTGTATAIVIVAALLFVFLIHWLNGSRGVWRWIERHLMLFFLAAWLFGFFVYCLGMYVGGNADEHSFGYVLEYILRVSPMCIVYAFEMFLFQSDISAVHETFINDVGYMTLFSVAHFMAATVSLMFVFKYFGYSIVSKLRRLAAARFGRKRHDLFIFWGQNEPSFHLAKSIKHNHRQSYRMLFVRTVDSEEAKGQPSSFDRLLNVLSLNDKSLNELKDLGCLSVESFRRLSMCELTAGEREDKNALILHDTLALRSVERLIGKAERVHIFMLGDDEESNIKAAGNICCDKCLNEFVRQAGRKATIYCHARYDSINRVIENEHLGQGVEVRIIDSAHMAVQTLKSRAVGEHPDRLCYPVHFVDVESDATVKSRFNAMVVGFGQCGRDAVKFLYEYGAFVERIGDDGDAVRSPFRCDVFDRDMPAVGSYYKSARPEASICLHGADGCDDGDKLIHLHKADISDERFWQYVGDGIARLNYIVITIKDDEAGINLAVRLLKQAIRANGDSEGKDELRARMERLRIFVRSYSLELLPHIRAIAAFYNSSVAKSLGLKRNAEPICLFGSVDEIYTWQNIVDDTMQKESYRFYNSYEGIDESEEHLGDAWAKRRKKELGEHPYGIADINSVRRKETQDMENAWHKIVKVWLARQAFGDEQAFMACAKAIAGGTLVRYEYDEHGERQMNKYNKPYKGVVYKELTPVGSSCDTAVLDDNSEPGAPLPQPVVLDGNDRRKIILDVLAQTEHLRWVASHQLLGYTHGADKDEATMTHDCLTTWTRLKDDETRGYDYSVVDTSLAHVAE